MLKDRRELLEHDLRIAKESGAKLYLEMIKSESPISDVYESLRERIAELEFDLAMVNKLIDGGSK